MVPPRSPGRRRQHDPESRGPPPARGGSSPRPSRPRAWTAARRRCALLAGFGVEVELRAPARGLPDGRRRHLDRRAGGGGARARPRRRAAHAARRPRGAPERDAMPAIAVALLPGGMPHFVVAWRRHGRFVQLMDPATGRRIVGALDADAGRCTSTSGRPVRRPGRRSRRRPAFQGLAPRAARSRSGLRRRAAEAPSSRKPAKPGGREMAALDAQTRALAAAPGPRRDRAASSRAPSRTPTPRSRISGPSCGSRGR